MCIWPISSGRLIWSSFYYLTQQSVQELSSVPLPWWILSPVWLLSVTVKWLPEGKTLWIRSDWHESLFFFFFFLFFFFTVSAANTFPPIKLHLSSTGTTLIDVMSPDFWQQPTGITKRVHVSYVINHILALIELYPTNIYCTFCVPHYKRTTALWCRKKPVSQNVCRTVILPLSGRHPSAFGFPAFTSHRVQLEARIEKLLQGCLLSLLVPGNASHRELDEESVTYQQ